MPPNLITKMNHFIRADQLTASLIQSLFDLSDEMPALRKSTSKPLAGKILANLFFEASTRSRMSFESAFLYLGGQVNSTVGVTFSSLAKGESLEDTIKVISSYCDVMVIRHPDQGSAEIAAKFASVPVINAGDGPGEHPTQALLDLYTIYKETGRVSDLHIVMMGDLKYGRTIHSLLRLLALYPQQKITCVAPMELQLPAQLQDLLIKKHKVNMIFTDDLDSSLSDADILYATRIQKERFQDPQQARHYEGLYVLDEEKLKCAPDTLRILHPLPRLSEITPPIDHQPQAAYFRQATNGLYVRMALFLKLLGISP